MTGAAPELSEEMAFILQRAEAALAGGRPAKKVQGELFLINGMGLLVDDFLSRDPKEDMCQLAVEIGEIIKALVDGFAQTVAEKTGQSHENADINGLSLHEVFTIAVSCSLCNLGDPLKISSLLFMKCMTDCIEKHDIAGMEKVQRAERLIMEARQEATWAMVRRGLDGDA